MRNYLDQDKLSKSIPKQIQLSMYESMLRQRLLDEKVVELYKKGLIQGIAHPCLGQEAVAAGVIANLSKEDLSGEQSPRSWT